VCFVCVIFHFSLRWRIIGHYWKPFFLCVPNFPECFSKNPQGNSIFLVGCRNTHREIIKHTGKFNLTCRLCKNSQGKLWTHREIKVFFVGWVNTHREIHEHTGKFIISLSVLEYSQENSRHTQGKWITRWIQMNKTCIVGLSSFNSWLKLVSVFLPRINSKFDDSFSEFFQYHGRKILITIFLNIFIWLVFFHLNWK